MNGDIMDESTEIEIQQNENQISSPMELPDIKIDQQNDQNIPGPEIEQNAHQISIPIELSDNKIEQLKEQNILYPEIKQDAHQILSDTKIDQQKEQNILDSDIEQDAHLLSSSMELSDTKIAQQKEQNILHSEIEQDAHPISIPMELSDTKIAQQKEQYILDPEIKQEADQTSIPMELSCTKIEEQNIPDPETELNMQNQSCENIPAITALLFQQSITVESKLKESKEFSNENNCVENENTFETAPTNGLPIDQDEEKETMKGSPLPDSELEDSNSCQEKIISNSKDFIMLSTTDTQDEIEYVDHMFMNQADIAAQINVAKQELLESEDSLEAISDFDPQTEKTFSMVSSSDSDEASQDSAQEKHIDKPVRGTENPVQGTNNPVKDIDKPKENKIKFENIDKNKENGYEKPKLFKNEIKVEKNKIEDKNNCITIDDNKKGEMKTNGEKPELRRSSRTVKLRKHSYVEQNVDDDSEEEVNLVNTRKRTSRPIIINDTKSLIEIAARQTARSTASDRREPQLVLIGSKPKLAARAPASKNTNISINSSLYQSIVERGTTVTPVPSKSVRTTISQAVQTSPIPPPILLPFLTDDMFVVEAPSFVVPYVYEKPSVKPFKEFVTKLGEDIEELRAKAENELVKQKEEKLKQERINEGEEVTHSEDKAKRDAEEKNRKIAKKEGRLRGQKEDESSLDGSVSTDSEDVELIDDNSTTLIIDDKDESIEGTKKSDCVPASSSNSNSYFDGSLGKFFTEIGQGLVEEYVQSDLLKTQQRKLQREKKAGQSTKQRELEKSISLLTKNYEISKRNNQSLKCVQIKCEYCTFKTESEIVLAQHMETPHMKNNMYKCNFCKYEIRSPHDILFHMDAEHNFRGRLEQAPAYHQCVNCSFEDNGKGKLARHLITCAKKFKQEHNLRPPVDWEPPAKIPKITKGRSTLLGPQIPSVSQGSSAHMSVPFGRPQQSLNRFGRSPMSSMLPGTSIYYCRQRARTPGPIYTKPPIAGGSIVRGSSILQQKAADQAAALAAAAKQLAVQAAAASQEAAARQAAAEAQAVAAAAVAALAKRNHPSISITAVPPRPIFPPYESAVATFVICEICDGYIKNLEQLRNHMQWIHKVKIHPKMILGRPPLNCQKCQFRFFTDLGLERHLLGSHGLVTTSMQDAANKQKDGGRCPICGKVFRYKMLSHVAREHSKELKPAHLSYKCTVCAAAFQMYKLFESHVYSAHSVVAKRVMGTAPERVPLKNYNIPTGLTINDEITITAQPAKPAKNK